MRNRIERLESRRLLAASVVRTSDTVATGVLIDPLFQPEVVLGSGTLSQTQMSVETAGGGHSSDMSTLSGSGVGASSGTAYQFQISSHAVSNTNDAGLSNDVYVSRSVITSADGTVFSGVVIDHSVTTPGGETVVVQKVVAEQTR